MRLAPQRRAIFRDLKVQKCLEPLMFLTFWLANVLVATAAWIFRHLNFQKCQFLGILTCKCAFSCLLGPGTSAPAALPSLLFDPADPQIIEKTQRFATSLKFRACGSSFYWLLRNCIFFLLTLLLFSAFHLLTLLLCSAFSTVHIVGS